VSLPGSDKALIYVHLFKCGGTTFSRLIEWEYSPLSIFSVDPDFFRWSYRRVLRWPAKRLARIKVFKGHMPFGIHRILPHPWSYITFLRRPIDREISAYHYARTHWPHPGFQAARSMSLEEYLRTTPYVNLQTKMIAGQDPGYDFLAGECTAETLAIAKENLSTYFGLVGLTERFDESLALAKILYGWRVDRYTDFNVTRRPRSKTVPELIKELIADRCRFDFELYEHGKKLFDEAMRRHGQRTQEELQNIKGAKNLSFVQSFCYRGETALRKELSRVRSAL
jgi:hypothetical protein